MRKANTKELIHALEEMRLHTL
ncbi:MAG: hypothetical protein RLZZ192_1765, partial [Pseudomonadota bacterium]